MTVLSSRFLPVLLGAVLSLPAAGGARAQEPAPAASTPPGPDAGLGGLALSLDLYGLGRLDAAGGMWDRERESALGLELGYDLLGRGEGFRVALAVGWFQERQGRTHDINRSYATGQGPSTVLTGNLINHNLHAAATLRWRSDRTVQPYLGLAFGGTRSELTLDPWSSAAAHSTAHGLLGRAGVGLRFQPRRLTARRQGGHALFAPALAIEMGAMAGTPLKHRLGTAAASSGEQEATPISVQPVPLGDLGRSAAYFRSALVVLF